MSLDLEGPDFEKTVHDHARYLGLDPARHPQLLWIAVEALTAKVPSDWRVAATKTGAAYFYNTRTRETMWEHPLDEQFKSTVREQLAKIGELSPDRGGTGRGTGRDRGGGNGNGNDNSNGGGHSPEHLPSSLSNARRRLGQRRRRRGHGSRHNANDSGGNADGSHSGNSDDGSESDGSSDSGHSQASRDAIVELESRLMQEVAQSKILQDQLAHEQALNRQYQARSAEADVTILRLRGEVAEQRSSLVASQSGETNQAEQTRLLQDHLHAEQQKALQLQENLSAASADVRYMQSTLSVYQTQVQSLQSRCTDLEDQCTEARQQAQKATNLESIVAAKNEILAQKNEDLLRVQKEMAADLSNGLPGVHALAGASLAQRTESARTELANQTLNAQSVALEGRAVQLEQQLAAARNRLQEALDSNTRLKDELLGVKHDLRTKAFELTQLQDEARVDRAAAELGLPPVSPSAADAAQRELTDMVNEAKQKRDAVGAVKGAGAQGGGGSGHTTADRHLQLKYARLKQQYEALDDRHAKLEEHLRERTQAAQLLQAQLRRELEEERDAARRVASEEKRFLAKSRVQLKQQQERLREEAAAMQRARADADDVIAHANLLTTAQSSASDARAQALRNELEMARQQLRAAEAAVAEKEEKAKMYIRHAVRETAAKVELKFQKKIGKLQRRNAELERLHSSTANAAAQLLASPVTTGGRVLPLGVQAVHTPPQHAQYEYSPHTLHQPHNHAHVGAPPPAQNHGPRQYAYAAAPQSHPGYYGGGR